VKVCILVSDKFAEMAEKIELVFGTGVLKAGLGVPRIRALHNKDEW